MIVCHKYKFIFVKTRKTAGTSIEIALSEFTEGNDILTAINKEDEEIRERLNFHSSRNFHVPYISYSVQDWINYLVNGKKLVFYNHMPAIEIKKYIPSDIWNTYYKFCFERHPYEKVVSLYFFLSKKRNIDISFSDFVKKNEKNLSDSHMYFDKHANLLVDKVYKYEEINESLSEISQILRLPKCIDISKINSKTNIRPVDATVDRILDDQSIFIINKAFNMEFENLGYNKLLRNEKK
jgi:hypothetical protein